MRNRWLHKPTFHSAIDGHEKKASWIELFYDLVFVAAFIQLGNGLAANVSVEGVVVFFLVFTPLWVVWTGQTYFMNRFNLDDIPLRLLIFFSMFCIGIMAVAAPYLYQNRSYFFSISAALCFASVAVCNLRAYLQVEQGKDYSRYWAIVYGFAALLWFVSCWIPKPYEYVVWAVGVLFVIAAPFSRPSREQQERYPIDHEHLSERYGILTIIVLGESFVKVISDLSHQDLNMHVSLQACFALMVTCAIWWLYFDDVAGTHLKKTKLSALIWLYGHLPLQAAITATGVAIYKVGSLDLSAVIPLKYRWLICFCLALVLFSVAVIDSVSERKLQNLKDNVRVNIRGIAGIFVLLMVPIGGSISGIYFVVAILAIIATLVIFDMVMAPFEQAAVHHLKTRSFAEVAEDRGKQVKNAKQGNYGRGDAIIKGVPNEFRHDIYSFFMEGGWARVFISAAVYFVFVNVFFAALFVIDPGSVANGEPGSIVDAFFFSVQTFSTIGYGNLNPSGIYSNTLVTIEAAVGLLSVALITGIIFAKASKPKSGIVFSDKALLITRDGELNLTFRLGNARGSEVVDATLNVSVVMDYTTKEGEHMRRLYDLQLVRSRTPLFRLTWSVFHVIDKDSPLYGLDLTSGDSKIWGLVATVVGHEAVYGETVFARKTYFADEIINGYKFADVLSQAEDGRVVVDFDKFHSVLPT